MCGSSTPDFTVGMDLPLMVLKMQLLNEKRQQLLLTAPGGCGKTTLVKMLGHDQEIKVFDLSLLFCVCNFICIIGMCLHILKVIYCASMWILVNC